MAKEKKAGSVQEKSKGYYAKAKSCSIASNNKEKKIKKHLKNHPSDSVAVAALNKGLFPYGRKTPLARRWHRSKALMKFAHTLRMFGYKSEDIDFECFVKPKLARNPTKKTEDKTENA